MGKKRDILCKLYSMRGIINITKTICANLRKKVLKYTSPNCIKNYLRFCVYTGTKTLEDNFIWSSWIFWAAVMQPLGRYSV